MTTASRPLLQGLALLTAVAAVLGLTAPAFLEQARPEPIEPGPGVTRVAALSAYWPGLAGTAGDTPVYVLEGQRPGGTALVLGGTHADEVAGVVAAALLVERGRVTTGRLLIIPHANASAATHVPPMEGYPRFLRLETPDGPRRFRVGSRLTNPIHQWPDPTVYVHAASGQTLSGGEVRNLNRAYPGRPDGSLTEQIAYAIVRLVESEGVDLVVDLHEASPEYPVVNTIVAHERAMELAASAALELQTQGIEIGVEPSPRNLRGLIHREVGDATDALAVLVETVNPGQGRLRGRTDPAIFVSGRDAGYVHAAQAGRLFVPFDEQGHPLSVRVARHVETVQALLRQLELFRPGRGIELEGLPGYALLVSQGVGAYLGASETGRKGRT